MKFALFLLLNLTLVIKNSCNKISENKEVIEYLQNFGYLTEDEKISLNKIEHHESLKGDKRLKRALKHLQVSYNKRS